MTFICVAQTGQPHHHVNVDECRRHWYLTYNPAPVVTQTQVPSVSSAYIAPMTQPQRDYIERLGGNLKFAEGFSKQQASEYITRLKANPPSREHKMNEPQVPVEDPRINMVKLMIGEVPDGYYALAVEGRNDQFIRISRPKRGRLAGSTQIQTQHSEKLADGAVIWSSGSMSFAKSHGADWNADLRAKDARRRDELITDLLELVVTHRDALLRYAEMVGRCGVCNLTLTDDRSRHYGVGPICEPRHTWIIARVDEAHDGRSFEQLRVLGRV